MTTRLLAANETATLDQLTALVGGPDVTITRHCPSHATFHKTGRIESAGIGFGGDGFGVMFKGHDFSTALALPRGWQWRITVAMASDPVAALDPAEAVARP